jgi:hypothetical protein
MSNLIVQTIESIPTRYVSNERVIHRTADSFKADLLAAVAPSPQENELLALAQEAAEEGCLRGRHIHCAEREPNPKVWCVPCKAKFILSERGAST